MNYHDLSKKELIELLYDKDKQIDELSNQLKLAKVDKFYLNNSSNSLLFKKLNNYTKLLDPKSADQTDIINHKNRLKLELIEKKLNEIASKNCTIWYQTIVDTMNEGFIFIDNQGKIIYINKQFIKLIGYSKDDLLMQPMNHFIRKDQIETFNKVLSIRNRENNIQYELVLVHKNKSEVYTIISPRCFFDKNKVTSFWGAVKDITEKKIAEQILKESEEKFRLISEQSLLAILIVQNGMLQYFNTAYLNLFKYTIEEIISWEAYEYLKTIHPEDRHIHELQIKSLIDENSNNNMLSCTYRGITKTDQLVWVDEFSKIIQFKNKNTILITLLEVTERKFAEEKVQETISYTRSLLDSSLDIIITTNSTREIVEFNKAAEENFGYYKYELIGEKIDILYLDPDIEVNKIKSYISRKGKFMGEVINKRKDGSIFPAYLTVSILYDSNSMPIGMVGISRNIFYQKKTEAALRDSESIGLALLNAPTESVYVIDTNGTALAANEVTLKRENKSLEEFIGCNVYENLPKELKKFRKGNLKKVIENKKPYYYEYPILGEWHSVRFYPVLNMDNEVYKVVIFSRDITETKKLEKEILRLTSEIHNSIKNNLESIKFFFNYGKSLIYESIDDAMIWFDKVEKLLQHVNNISRNILFVTKNKECSIDQFISELEARAQITLENAKIKYLFESYNYNKHILVSPEAMTYLLEIFTEGLNNIAKHSSASFVFIELLYEDDSFVLNIEDDGEGFDYSTQKDREESYGLEIMEQLKNNMDAELKIISKPNHGTSIIAKIKNL